MTGIIHHEGLARQSRNRNDISGKGAKAQSSDRFRRGRMAYALGWRSDNHLATKFAQAT